MARGYTCYRLADTARVELMTVFVPRFPKMICEHVTHKFYVKENEPILNATVRLIGYKSCDGLECLVVEVNGNSVRSDGSLYHITLSYNPEAVVADDIKAKAAEKGFNSCNTYIPAHSNFLLQQRGYQELQECQKMFVDVEPKFYNFQTKAFEAANVV